MCHEEIPRVFGQPARPPEVRADELPVALQGAAVYPYGVHVRRIHAADDRPHRIYDWRSVDALDVEHHYVRLLAWRERAGLVGEPADAGTLDGGELQDVPRGQQRRRIFQFLVEDALVDPHALSGEQEPHLREQVAWHAGHDVATEAGTQAVLEQLSGRRHA